MPTYTGVLFYLLLNPGFHTPPTAQAKSLQLSWFSLAGVDPLLQTILKVLGSYLLEAGD